MKIASKKTSELLKVDNNFAQLLKIEGGIFYYKFEYRSSTIDALRKGANIVRLSVRKSLPLQEDNIFKSAGKSNYELIEDILHYEPKKKSAKRDDESSILVRKNSDITSKLNNDLISSIKLSSLPASSIMPARKVVDLKTVTEIRASNLNVPVIQNSVARSQETSSRQGHQVAAVDMIFNDGVDPSTVAARYRPSVGTEKAFRGVAPIAQEQVETPTVNAQDSRRRFLIDTLLSNVKKTITLGDLAANTPVPVVSNKKQIDVRNSELVLVPEVDVGLEDFYVIFELITSTGEVLESQARRVNHSFLSKVFNTPRLPPSINISPTQISGRNVLEVQQNDPIAMKVGVYRRSIKKSDPDMLSSVYQFIAELKLTQAEGIVKFTDVTNNSHINLYRCISIGPGNAQGAEFANAVAIAQKGIGGDASHRQAFASLSAINSPSGVEVLVENVSPGPIAVAILKRDKTVFQKEFQFIKTDTRVILINDGLQNTLFIDSDVKDSHVYEYICRLYYNDGSVLDSSANVLHEFIKHSVGVVTAKISNLQVIKNSSRTDVSFNVASKIEATDLDAVKKTLEKQGLASLFSEELKLERNKLQRLIAHNIVRLNLTTGEKEDFGTITDEIFIDSAASVSTSIKPLKVGNNYRYIITTLLRDAETTFDDYVKSADDVSTGKSYTFKPAKFLHPFTLKTGTLIDRQSHASNHPQDDFAMGRIGNPLVINVPLSISLPSIKKISATRVSTDTVNVRWVIDGDVTFVEHYIIIKDNLGMSAISGKVHHVTSNNTFEFYDTLESDDIGEISYRVIPVLNDYKRGLSSNSATVIIKDGRI